MSIMHVNNETGAVNDLQKIVKLTKSVAPKSIVHSDGVQALMKVKVNLMSLGVDMYSVSAHKVHAPRGVGGLYIRKGVRINPLILGGGRKRVYEARQKILRESSLFQKFLKNTIKCSTKMLKNEKSSLIIFAKK